MLRSSAFRFRCAALCAVLLVLLLTVQCAAADGIAVRVNDRVYTVETVQKYVNETAANMPLTFGMTAGEAFEGRHEEFLQAAADHFVTVAIVMDKLHAKGLDKISAEEDEALQEYARQTYEQLWQGVADKMKEEEPDVVNSDRLITQTLENAGYSMDGIYEKGMQELLMERFTVVFCPEVTVTDEELRSYYHDTYTEPDRQLYENNIPLFEEYVLQAGESSTYIPEGYFYVKFIAMNPSEQRIKAILHAEQVYADAHEETAAAQEALAQAALLDDADLTAARERYKAAQAAEEQAAAALDEQQRLAEADYAPMMDLIEAARENGDPFESLIGKYSAQPMYTAADEPGYPFHPLSESWEENVRLQIAALEKNGDCTQPIYTGGSVCIYCRMADMPGGEYEPDEATWAEMRRALLLAKQNVALDEKVTEWRADYDIEIDLSGLVFPND